MSFKSLKKLVWISPISKIAKIKYNFKIKKKNEIEKSIKIILIFNIISNIATFKMNKKNILK